MKKIYLLIILLISTISVAQEFNIEGKWIGTDTDGGKIIMSFDSKGFVTLSDEVETYGGEHCEIEEGTFLALKYEVNLETDPLTLDFILYEVNSEDKFDRKRGYFKIINKDTIELKHEAFSELGTWYEDMHTFVFKRES